MKAVLSIKRLINFLIPKKKNYIYALPHSNGKIDCYDLLNANSDNVLCVVNALLKGGERVNATVFIECYDIARIPQAQEYIAQCNKSGIKIKLLAAGVSSAGKKQKVKNLLIRYRCGLWVSDAMHVGYQDKISRQKLVCLNYSTPLKSATDIDVYGDLSYIDGIAETSLLTAMMHAAEYNIKLKNTKILGFPRNDTLFVSDKEQIVRKWVSDCTDAEYQHIIVYAPTYRDYPEAYSSSCIFGFSDDGNKLDAFLEKHKILVIAKMHPLQEVGNSVYTKRVIPYEKTFGFSLYDLLAVSDMLISDYSSVIHDYIITGKKVVLAFFDRERYETSRGFAFEPIEYICPGPIAENIDEFISAVSEGLSAKENTEKYNSVAAMFHRYRDGSSTERAVEYLLSLINERGRK